MDYWRADAGRSQGKETVKHQFREGNLLRWADVRGNAWAVHTVLRAHASVRPHERGEHLSLISFFWDASIIQAVSILYKGSGRGQTQFSWSCFQPHSPFREHSSHTHITSFTL